MLIFECTLSRNPMPPRTFRLGGSAKTSAPDLKTRVCFRVSFSTAAPVEPQRLLGWFGRHLFSGARRGGCLPAESGAWFGRIARHLHASRGRLQAQGKGRSVRRYYWYHLGAVRPPPIWPAALAGERMDGGVGNEAVVKAAAAAAEASPAPPPQQQQQPAKKKKRPPSQEAASPGGTPSSRKKKKAPKGAAGSVSDTAVVGVTSVPLQY